MWHDCYRDVLEDIASDHVPVLLRCVNRGAKPQAPSQHHTRWAWRLERLRDVDTLEQYKDAIAKLAGSLPAAASWPTSGQDGQRHCDAMLARCIGVFERAADAVLGRRCIRPGYTLRHMDSTCKAYIDARIAAHSAYTLHPTAATAAAARAAREHAKTSLRHMRQVQQHKAALGCISAWDRAPGSRDAHRMLKNLTGRQDQSHIDALQHPQTGGLCFGEQDKTEALRSFYSDLFARRPPEHERARAQAARSKATVTTERTSEDDGPTRLAARCTPAEVEVALSLMRNNRAPGDDRVPVELFKCSGEAGVSLLVDLFNAILVTECVPSQWRKGIIVSVYKKGDPTQCNNYRGLTLLSAADKLWASIITRRVGKHVTLHDHQYGFRPGRGTLNALFNLSTVIRTRKASGQGTYVFFLDAKKAFDTVPHHALLARLHDKGVTGKLWRIIDRMYLQASSAVRIGSTTSAAIPVQRGVAQGCPLSPLLYDIFVDSLLDSVHADVSDDGIHFDGLPGHSPTVLVGQSYADDMAGVASTARGLQRLINCVRSHSLEWEWEANTQKSVVMAFGNRATLRSAQAERWFWGTTPLQRVSSIKYLGLHFHESGCWDEHVAQVAAKGHRVLGQWLPVLANPMLPVSLKRRVIVSRLLPVLTYGMEVWNPLPSCRSEDAMLKPLSDVIDKACRVAAGLHRTAGTRAWQKRTCVSEVVLLSDFQLLPLPVQLDLAHSRYGVRCAANDAQVLQVQSDCLSSSSHPATPPAFVAPDVMGATIRNSLDAGDPWRSRSRTLCQHGVPRDQRVTLPDAARAAAVNWKLRHAATAPSGPSCSRRQRARRNVIPRAAHHNPVPLVLRQLSNPPYLGCTSPTVWPIMSFRSARMPHTYTAQARQSFMDDVCPTCEEYLVPSQGTVSDAERRWCHIYHRVFACSATACTIPYAPLQALLEDAAAEATRFHLPDLAALFAYFTDSHSVHFQRDRLVSFLLDPVAFCAPFSSNSLVGRRMACLAAAFCLEAGAHLGHTAVHREHIRALNLPKQSKLHTRVFPEDYVYPFPAPLASSDSEDELVLPGMSPPPSVPGAPALPAVLRDQTTVPVFSLSGPDGLHEADARHNG